MDRERDFKTRPEQWGVMLDFFEEHPNLLKNKFDSYNDNSETKKLWETLICRVNAMGYGQKSIEKWQLAISRWKSKTKSKAAAVRREAAKTGGGVSNVPPLTDLEERMMAILGWKYVDGDKNEEFGLGSRAKSGKTPTSGSPTQSVPRGPSPPPLVAIVAAPLGEVTNREPQASSYTKNRDIVSRSADADGVIAPSSRKRKNKTEEPFTKRKVVTSTPKTRRFTSLANMHAESLVVLKNIDENFTLFVRNQSRQTQLMEQYLELQLRNNGDSY